MQFVITSLTKGLIYKIAVRAVNSQGASVLGDYVLIGASELPRAPLNLYKEVNMLN
jgi:hypothetical protein